MRDDERTRSKMLQGRTVVLLLVLAIIAVPAVALGTELHKDTTELAFGVAQETLQDPGAYTYTTSATPAPLPSNRHIFFHVANDAGVKYNLDGATYGEGNNNTYYIKADGGGLNELHITTDPGTKNGQVTESVTHNTDPSGAFYITNTGSAGMSDNLVLLLAVNGAIPDDFSVTIRSGGYAWTPNSTVDGLPDDYAHYDGMIEETFTKTDLRYGPQTWKPGPGTLGVPPYLPLYYGQDQGDGQTYQLMFIDLRVGALNPTVFSGLTDSGAAKVEYTFDNLTDRAAFNVYGWRLAAAQGQGISWTNRVSGTGSSGYSVISIPSAPVANFSANVTTGEVPLAVAFTDTSTGSPTSWAWGFGDGSTSTAQHPVHTYAAPGTYTVNLTVANDAGNDSEARTDYIVVISNVKGDFNGDGRVDIGDVAKVAYMVVGKTDAHPAADFNENGAVDIGDAAKIAYYFIGKIAIL